MNLPAHKFKPGDRVVQKSSNYKGVVRSASIFDSSGQPIYYVDFDEGWMGNDVIKEVELELAEVFKPSTVSKTKCECGAHVTSFPNLHSTWCPLTLVD